MYNVEKRMQEIMEAQKITAVERKSKSYSEQLNRLLTFKK
jgi:hypothetical protein